MFTSGNLCRFAKMYKTQQLSFWRTKKDVLHKQNEHFWYFFSFIWIVLPVEMYLCMQNLTTIHTLEDCNNFKWVFKNVYKSNYKAEGKNWHVIKLMGLGIVRKYTELDMPKKNLNHISNTPQRFHVMIMFLQHILHNYYKICILSQLVHK